MIDSKIVNIEGPKREQSMGTVVFLLFLMALFFVVTNSDSTSPLFPNAREIDSGIFQYMGYIITQGKVPYTEFFDHKGLLMYFIDAVGILMSKYWGIFLLQVIHMTLVLLVWYKGLVCVKDARLRIFLIAVTLTCLYYCYGMGNLTEEWSLLFISYPLMTYFVNMHKGVRLFNDKELLLIGLCIGCMMMLRLNNFFPVMGVPLYCACIALKEKDYSYVLRAFVLIMLGSALPIILCVIYMYIVGGIQGLEEMLFANVTFNLQYRESYQGGGIDVGRVKFFHRTIIPFLFVLYICRKQKDVAMPLVIGYVLGLLTMGKTGFHHYLMVFIPLVVYSLGILRGWLRWVLVAVLLLTNIRYIYQEFSVSNFVFPTERLENRIGRMLSVIPNEDRDKIWNYNTTPLLKDYMYNDLVLCNRAFLPFQLDKSETLMRAEKNKICSVRPKYILLLDKRDPLFEYEGSDVDRQFIERNYSLISATSVYDGKELQLYRINEK